MTGPGGDLGRVLVTGPTGIVGWSVLRALAGRARHVRVLVRNPQRVKGLLPGMVEAVPGDLLDAGSLARAVDGCDSVFHAAGMPEQWLRDPGLFRRVNVDGTRALADAALKAGVTSFVYTSTVDVFRRRPGIPFDESVLETEPLATAYERSKQLADRAVVEALHQGLPARFLHPAAVFGPAPTTTPGVNDLVRRLVRGRAPALPPGGLPLVFAPDVGDGHVAAAEAPIGGRYILCDRYLTMRQLADMVADLVPGVRRPPSLPAPLARLGSTVTEALARRTGQPPLLPSGQLHFMAAHVVPDATRARTELGWRPTALHEALRITLFPQGAAR